MNNHNYVIVNCIVIQYIFYNGYSYTKKCPETKHSLCCDMITVNNESYTEEKFRGFMKFVICRENFCSFAFRVPPNSFKNRCIAATTPYNRLLFWC